MSMRGLTVFIADIRNCRVRELEEKRINKEMANIRSKFKEGNLNGYQKKKYVCKLLYMYILGWEIDFGHLEAVNLISSQKYSEKQIGYLAVTLLFHENSDLVRLVVNSTKKDLDDMNEINNCLALHAIANIGGREMAESLATDVHRLLISPTSKSFVKKKAALTLLRLFRKHPDVVPVTDWADRIISLMDEYDLGVALSVTTLVLALAQAYPMEYAGCYDRAVHRLKRILIDRDYSLDYIYYKVPTPWLQVKCLRLLQYYPPPEDAKLRSDISELLQIIITNSQDTPKNVQHSNAQNAVLFEAISLAIHLDSNSTICAQAAALLGRFISCKETNVRYLGLETMAHLAACADSLEPVKRHQETILMSLRDKDISVRRRGLDLLYSMCDTTNAKIIVSELLRYLQIADYAMREEMVLKIAILAEKFATAYSWYVDIILQLISTAGEQVGEEVWFRVVQIVTNNEELQEYAAKTVLNYLGSPQYNETMVKVGGYILGEFGHLIANFPGCSPIEQFNAVHSKFNLCSLQTRALLLTTYVKFVNLFPEIKSQVLSVFNQYRYVLDSELQQRACEYLAISTMSTDDMLQTVCEEMPPFPERESTLLLKLNQKHGDTEDKRVWVIGGKEANLERQEGLKRMASMRMNSTDTASASPASARAVPPDGHPQQQTTATKTANVESEADLLAFDNLQIDSRTMTSNSNSRSPSPVIPAHLPLASGYELGFNRLQYHSQGVLYEDPQMQVSLKSEFHAAYGRIALYLGNKTQYPMSHVYVKAGNHQQLNINVLDLHGPSQEVIGSNGQIQRLIQVECTDAFTESPSLFIGFRINGGDMQHLHLKLPVVLTKFQDPIGNMDGPSFFRRWNQIGGPPRESQIIFQSRVPIQLSTVSSILQGYQFGLLQGVDPNTNNFVGAGVIDAGKNGGKIGALLRLEPNLEQNMYRLTLRTPSESVSEHVRILLERTLTHGF
ncbi:adaptin N terminal region-domain-containing protein [Radiomyces spectabilis]|uniref:adaptin N terminal region-domain-containing protein n=1 Tax=Radiomyces spectabilis TaxID=64574 RepID=UPI00221E4B5C|nr:adaptin N terminal region-domain-containing protein [Radiomyces spectabilis]KAI8368286.1 adaptin N terminal region-domain-containing protein [Radiomyces spectabilis]